MERHLQILELITRLARLEAASAWDGALNPTQRALLIYLGRANRFSRGPSQVAQYLGTTRGTISQSFKSLLHKGYVSERRSTYDKRAISFDLTAKGKAIAQSSSTVEQSISKLDGQQKQALQASLSGILKGCLKQNDGRPFGVCGTCVHFEPANTGGFCKLLSEPLTADDAALICFEHESA